MQNFPQRTFPNDESEVERDQMTRAEVICLTTFRVGFYWIGSKSETLLILKIIDLENLSHNLPTPRSLVRDGQTHPHRPRLVVSHSTCPPLSSFPPRAQLCNRSCSNKTHTL